jgi:hypothetical protein
MKSAKNAFDVVSNDDLMGKCEKLKQKNVQLFYHSMRI